MTPDLPDIVLVVLDTARSDRFSTYGYSRPTTPTVDALAEEGLLVDPMMANGPWTLPSHGSLFTGLYPSQHGCQWQTGRRLRGNVSTTMAQWLRDRGYTTVCGTNNGLISERTGLARGFDRYGFRLEIERGTKRLRRRARKALLGGDSGGWIINDWVDEQMKDLSGPVFVFVNYLECHWAYAPPRRYERRVGGPRYGYLEGLRYRLELAARVGPWEAIARADDRDLEIYSTLYDGELLNADAHLAELIEILRRNGRLRDGRSIVIVCSDHGEHIGEHGLADHQASLDDHLLQVPFVAWGPGIVPAERRDSLYELVDVFPSLIRLLGDEIPEELRGRRSDLFHATADERSNGYAFAEWRAWQKEETDRLARRNPSYDFAGLEHDLLCVRDARFKLVRSSIGAEWLFDLESDPTEQRDVAAIQPTTARRLSLQLDSAVEGWRRWEDEPAPISEQEEREIEQRLSELGYI